MDGAANSLNRKRTQLALGLMEELAYSGNSDVVDVFFAKLHEWTAPWGAETASGSAGSTGGSSGGAAGGAAGGSVVYALDPKFAGWAAAGVPKGEVPFYVELGFSPDVVKRWVQAGLDVLDMVAWSKYLNVEELDPVLVAGWAEYDGPLSFEDIGDWLYCGVPAGDAVRWHEAGWNRTSPDITRMWYEEFGESDVEPADLFVNFQNTHSVSEVRRWVERGIAGVKLEEFHAKGFTPAEAEKFLGGEQVGSAVPVLWESVDGRTRKLEGRTWSRVRNRARGNGWYAAAKVREERSGVFPRTMITFMNERVKGEQVRVVLQDGGKFYSAYRYVERLPWVWCYKNSYTFNELLDKLGSRKVG